MKVWCDATFEDFARISVSPQIDATAWTGLVPMDLYAAKAFRVNDHPEAILCAIRTGHIANVYAVFSDVALKDHVFAIARGAVRWLRWIESREGVSRVQTIMDPAYGQGLRWIEWLGFEREGCMRRATVDGADRYLYGRV